MEYILVKQGEHRGNPIQNTVFRLVKPMHRHASKNRIQVCARETAGFPDKTIYIYIPNSDAIEAAEKPAAYGDQRTDEQIQGHIGDVFEFMELLTEGTCQGKVRATIISGGAGVGKSFGVEKILRESSIYDRLAWDEDGEDDEDVRRTEVVGSQKKFQPKYTILKGATSAVILYATLHKYSEAGEVLVLDDSDSVFQDIDSLNILKAALDTGPRRILTYSKDSHILKEKGVPNKFEYKGSIIFITNIDFEAYCENRPNSSLTPHLKALMSRCHYLDMGLHTPRERLLQVKLVHETSGFLFQHGCDAKAAQEVIDYMDENAHCLREVSLRAAISIAEKRALAPTKWRQMTQLMEFKKQYRGC